jgi:cell fate regulator YaaT (PSP1 superfamily)
MNNVEFAALTVLLKKFIKEHAGLDSGIVKIEYQVPQSLFFIEYTSFGNVNTFYTVEDFIKHFENGN